MSPSSQNCGLINFQGEYCRRNIIESFITFDKQYQENQENEITTDTVAMFNPNILIVLHQSYQKREPRGGDSFFLFRDACYIG